METIKTYLDNMFHSLPDTGEVRKAKEELYQMMEDKYLELKSEGKSENEAIGIVIAEFGNLDEIKEELNISNVYYENSEEKQQEKYVSLNQAKEYLSMTRKFSNYIAVGVMLCIFSPTVLLLMGGLTEISHFNENHAGLVGLLVLFLFIIAAVAIFIYSGNQMEEYEYLKKEIFRLESGTEVFVNEEKRKNKPSYSFKIMIGAILCIFSVIPLLCAAFLLNDFACIISVCILLLIVGVGAAFLISAGMAKESYEILLQEGEYKKSAKNKQMQAFSTAYWCVITAIYLGWSFLTFKWGITWIIWPIAGVLYSGISAIYGAVRKNN